MRQVFLVLLWVVYSNFSLLAQVEESEYQDIDETVEEAAFEPVEINEGEPYNFDEHFTNLHIEKQTLTRVQLDSVKWKKLVKDYDYSNIPKPKKLEPTKIRDWKLPRPKSFLGLGQVLLIIFLLIVLTVLVILIIRQVRKSDVRIDDDDVWWQIDLEKSDSAEIILSDRLKNALDNGEYAVAIRLHYLQILNELNRHNFIRWKKDKTNADYIRELKSLEFHNDFRQLTRRFERAWFGRKITNRETYLAFFGGYESILIRIESLSTKSKKA